MSKGNAVEHGAPSRDHPRSHVWTTFAVDGGAGAAQVAQALVSCALQAGAGRMGPRVAVLRALQGRSERFFFTPEAAPWFRGFLARHHAVGCAPPAPHRGCFRLHCGYVGLWVPWDGRYPVPGVRE